MIPVMGYCPMRRYLTGRSVYQDDYSKPAFDILKRDFDRGVIRLAPRHNKAQVINYAVPPCQVVSYKENAPDASQLMLLKKYPILPLCS